MQDKDRKPREGIPMKEQEIKAWQQAFIDIEESIKGLNNERKSSKKSPKGSKQTSV